MFSKPYLRATDDGTYELLVPSRGTAHVLPYCFHNEADAASWLATRKGRDHIQQIRSTKKRERVSARYAPQT